MNQLIQHLLSETDGTLIAVCVRPGDGRRTFSIALANELTRQGEPVAYYSYSESPTGLESTLSFAADKETPPNGVWILDDLTAWANTLTLADPRCTKIAILSRLRQLAHERGLKIVVTDTHAHYTDRQLPIPDGGLALCDAVYERHKEEITQP